MDKFRKLFSYPPALLNSSLAMAFFAKGNPLWRLASKFQQTGAMSGIAVCGSKDTTPIDEFWSRNTVYVPEFQSALQSWINLKWRFWIHPQFKELTGLYGQHAGEVVLDYGCGPGNDLVGFALYSGAQKVIGMDVSYKSLALASHRLALHQIPVKRIELIQIHDAEPGIPLPDETVDFVNCQGVLMHTSYPDKILAEFFRVLKPGSRACVMVYSRPSIWFHLYTAYEQMILKGAFSGLEVEQAFSRNTDGVDCPMARCYLVDEFVAMCEKAGFECRFAGGYLTDTEMISVRRYLRKALSDPRLEERHKEFLRALTFDKKKLPIFQGYYAGVSGVYHLLKPKD